MILKFELFDAYFLNSFINLPTECVHVLLSLPSLCLVSFQHLLKTHFISNYYRQNENKSKSLKSKFKSFAYRRCCNRAIIRPIPFL